jgi:hypothetical protein
METLPKQEKQDQYHVGPASLQNIPVMYAFLRLF